jgi:hypothetical protein
MILLETGQRPAGGPRSDPKSLFPKLLQNHTIIGVLCNSVGIGSLFNGGVTLTPHNRQNRAYLGISPVGRDALFLISAALVILAVVIAVAFLSVPA